MGGACWVRYVGGIFQVSKAGWLPDDGWRGLQKPGQKELGIKCTASNERVNKKEKGEKAKAKRKRHAATEI